MPSDPFKVPALTASATAKLGAENAAPTATQPTTAQATLDAKKLITVCQLSYELEEDSVVAMLPVIKSDIVSALAEGIENAAINGDDSATHQDADVTATDDVRKAWKGYRKLALSAAKVDLATFNIANLRAIRKAMRKYGVDQNQLAWIAGISVYNQMLSLSEVTTVDKYGPNATVLAGELAKLDGIPVIVSEFVREDLNATGVYDGTTTTKTIVLLVRRDGFLYGDRRTVLIETDKDVKAQTTDVVASQRIAFAQRILPATSERIVGLGYNITS